MDGARFLLCLSHLVGEANADLYARRFGPLNDRFYGNLLNFEGLAFFVYTTSLDWHSVINRELWSGTQSAHIIAFKDTLNGALRKLPRYAENKSLVYRGYRAGDLEAFLSRYPTGGEIKFLGFTSAALTPDDAFGGNVFFVIRTLTARMIWYLSANYHESEVLIPAGQTFSILSVKRGSGRVVIYLEEKPS